MNTKKTIMDAKLQYSQKHHTHKMDILRIHEYIVLPVVEMRCQYVNSRGVHQQMNGRA